MRLLGYIALLGGLFYAFVLYAKSRITMSISLAKLNIPQLISVMSKGSQAVLKTDLDLKVKNDNAFTIRASDLNVQIFYEGVLIAKSENKPSKRIIVLAKSEASFIHTLDVILSQQFFGIIGDLKSGQPLALNYIVRIRLFGIPITYKNKFTYTKQ